MIAVPDEGHHDKGGKSTLSRDHKSNGGNYQADDQLYPQIGSQVGQPPVTSQQTDHGGPETKQRGQLKHSNSLSLWTRCHDRLGCVVCRYVAC